MGVRLTDCAAMGIQDWGSRWPMAGAPAQVQGREDRASLSPGWWEPSENRSQSCWLPAPPLSSRATRGGSVLWSVRLGGLGEVLRTPAVWPESSLSSPCLPSSFPGLFWGSEEEVGMMCLVRCWPGHRKYLLTPGWEQGLGAPGRGGQCQPAWVPVLALPLSSYMILESYLASPSLRFLFCETEMTTTAPTMWVHCED